MITYDWQRNQLNTAFLGASDQKGRVRLISAAEHSNLAWLHNHHRSGSRRSRLEVKGQEGCSGGPLHAPTAGKTSFWGCWLGVRETPLDTTASVTPLFREREREREREIRVVCYRRRPSPIKWTVLGQLFGHFGYLTYCPQAVFLSITTVLIYRWSANTLSQPRT